MAETKFINFRYGTYDEINGLGKDANCIYIASDKPLLYAVGKWHGIASMSSEVDRVNNKTILKINGDGGYVINCEIEGETLSKDLKEKLINAYDFVQLISGEDEDVIINKWNEIVAFLQGFGEADKLLNVVVELQKDLADEVANRISADQKHTEDIKSITDLVNDMFTLVDKGDGTKYIQSKYGFASDSFISARGVDEESGGVGGLDAQAVWDLLMQNDDATKVINIAHIPDISIAKITDIANASVANAVNANKLDGKPLANFMYSRPNNFTPSEVASISTGAGYSYCNSGSGWKVDGGVMFVKNSNTGFALQGRPESLYYQGYYGDTVGEIKQLAFRETTLSGYGITDAVDLTSAQTIDGIKTFSNLIYQDTDVAGNNAWSRGIFLRCKKNTIGAIGAYGPNSSTLSHLYLGWGASPAIAANNLSVGENKFTYKDNTIYHAGNLSPVTTNTDQTITGVKTFSNLRVNNSTMIANLNAEMVGGYNANKLVKQESNIKTSIYSDNFIGYGASEGGWISYGAALNIGATNGYGMLMQMSLSDGYIYTKARKAGVLDQTWKQLAFTDSNVASATKLKTPRNIWGHNFDGTADVLGDLSYVKTIHAYNNAGLRISANSLDYSPTSVGELARGLLISSDSAYGLSIWNDGSGKAYLQVGRTDGINTAYSLILQHLDGNVGIGTTSPTAKLHVNGTALIAGNTTINGNLQVSNQLTIGNATLYWDVANQCLRVNSGIASDSFLSAKGIDTTGNGQGGGGGFDATMLWNELTIPSPTNSGKTIMLDLLPDMPTSKVTDFANQVKALITVENIPILTSAKISDFNTAVATAMASTLADISSEFTTVNNKITTANTNISSLEERIVAIERALTWQGI